MRIAKVTLFLMTAVCVAGLTGCKISNNGDDGITYDYKKPEIRSIAPLGIVYNETGFFLTAYADHFEYEDYTLYLDNVKLEPALPNYWRYRISWEVTPDVLKRVLKGNTGTNVSVAVRITPIQDDISGKFSKYAQHISDVQYIEITHDKTDFTAPVKLFDLWNASTDPQLRSDVGGNLHLAWREKIEDNYQAFFSFSRDRGATWSQVLNISRSDKNVTMADMEVDGAGNFYMAWSEGTEEEPMVYFSRSLDGGATWFLPAKISGNDEFAFNPNLEIDTAGRLILTYTNFDSSNYGYNKIWMAVSENQGDLWDYQLVTETANMQCQPALKAGKQGELYLTTGDYDNMYWYYLKEPGWEWQIHSAPTEGFSGQGQYPSIGLGENGKVYLVWNSSHYLGHNYNNWIHFISGTEHGAQWQPRIRIDDTCDTNGRKASLAVKDHRLTMCCSDGLTLFLTRSDDDGKTWSYPEFIPGTRCDYRPSANDMVIDNNGDIFLVYTTWTDIGFYTGDLYFIRSTAAR